MIVVCNATPLIGLAKLDRLSLIRELFGSILIPQAVYDEVVLLAPDCPGAAEVRQADWIGARAVTDRIKVTISAQISIRARRKGWFWRKSWRPIGFFWTNRRLAWLPNSLDSSLLAQLDYFLPSARASCKPCGLSWMHLREDL